MANSMFNPDKGLNEMIAFERINESKTTINSKNTPKRGVLVINPNKVMDESRKIYDRYIKQEDLTIYCSLKVFKKEEISVISGDGESSITPENPPIMINMLNPLKTNSTINNKAQYKGKFTTEWTDFFTSDAANNRDSDSYIIDPETFGISSISYTLNANLIPKITMTFIDIQGRLLFERGNDINNPYNIFFTYPYPKFLLTYKGYYGKSVELPLVLLKSNYRFDPQTGNYTITCEMQSDVFSMLNSLLIIYAYTAPYMYLTKEGDYLGNKILSKIYEEQNKKFSDKYGAGTTDFNAREITTNPTLWDLANAIKKIPYNALNNNTSNNGPSQNSDDIKKNKLYIQQFETGVINFFNDDNKYIADIREKKSDAGFLTSNKYPIFLPKNNDYQLNPIDGTPVDLYNITTQLNDYISQINNTAVNLQRTDQISKFKANIKKYISAPDLNNLIKPDLFYFDGDSTVYTLDSFNSVMYNFYQLLDLLQQEVEDSSILSKINDIKEYLGYQPNMSNIIRIICNNIQTFLILLELVSHNSLKQIKTDPTRGMVHKNNTTHKVTFDNRINFYSPFPNFYKKIPELKNGETNHRNVLAYPGVDEANKDWFEVDFINEFYNSITRLNKLANPVDKKSFFGTKKTGLITLFGLGEDDLATYENKTSSNDLILEMFKKYSLHLMYSGLMYRGMDSTTFGSTYAKPMAQFELKVQDEMVLQNLSNNARFILGNTIKNLTQKGELSTNFGGFGRNYMVLAGGENGYNQYVRSVAVPEILLLDNSYTRAEFDKVITAKNSFIKKNVKNNIYNKLYDTSFSPKQYSITKEEGKESESGVIIKLEGNKGYYSIDSDILNTINDGLLSVVNENSPYQGFYNKMNKNMRNVKINTDLNNDVKSVFNKVPAITFSSPITQDNKIFSNVESFRDFSVFNNI
jgi:hypothetical protein